MTQFVSNERFVFTRALYVDVKQQVGSDRMICDAARVSTLGEDAEAKVRTIDQDAGLIRYLMKNKHGSPFEHGSITFIVTAPIFVFWDHVRHRIGVSYNIESSRYRDLEPRFFIETSSRVQTGKPGHYTMSPGTPEQDELMMDEQMNACHRTWDAYQAQLAKGIAREQAMQILPMNTIISAYVTFNPRSLMKFLELRLGPARLELQRLANMYAAGFEHYWTATHAAFEAAGRIAP